MYFKFQFIIFYLVLINSLAFNIMKHPLFLMVNLFFQTFLICLFLGNLFQFFWFSYILFLIFIGGILILFTYIVSLINFKMNKYFNKYLFLFSLVMMMIIMTIYFSFSGMAMTKYHYFMFKDYNLMNMFKLFKFSLNIMNMFMINFLFFMLMISMKFTKNFYGPLRMKF